MFCLELLKTPYNRPWPSSLSTPRSISALFLREAQKGSFALLRSAGMAALLSLWAIGSGGGIQERWQCELLDAEDPRRRTCGLDHATRGTLPHRIECGNSSFPCNVDHANAYRARFLAGVMPCCPTPPYCHAPACAGVVTQGLSANAKAWSNLPMTFVQSSTIMLTSELAQPSAKPSSGGSSGAALTPEINPVSRHLLAPEAPDTKVLDALHIPGRVSVHGHPNRPRLPEPERPVFFTPMSLKAALLLEPGYLVGATKREQLAAQASERELVADLISRRRPSDELRGEEAMMLKRRGERGPVRKFQQAFVDFVTRVLGLSRQPAATAHNATAHSATAGAVPHSDLHRGEAATSHADAVAALDASRASFGAEHSRAGKGVRSDAALQPETLRPTSRVPDKHSLTLTALPEEAHAASAAAPLGGGSGEEQCSPRSAADNFAYLTRQDVWPVYHGFGGSFEADLQKYTDLLGCRDNATGACPYHPFDLFLDVGASTGEATESMLKRHVARDYILVEANGELVQNRLQTRWGSRDFVSKFLSALASKGPAVRRRPDAPRPRFSIIEATASAASRAAEEVDMCVVEPAFGQGPRGQAGCLRRTTTVDAVLQSQLPPAFGAILGAAESMLVRVSTEGMDGLVLQGMQELLQARRGQYADGRPRHLVNLIQFEYNPALWRMVRAREGLPLSLYSLKNVTAMLEQQGFETFLVGPRYLPLSHGAWDDRIEAFTGDPRNNDGMRKAYPGFHSLICAWCESLGQRNITSATSEILAIRSDYPRAAHMKRGLGACEESREFDPSDPQNEQWGRGVEAAPRPPTPSSRSSAESRPTSIIQASSARRQAQSLQQLPNSATSSAHVLVASPSGDGPSAGVPAGVPAGHQRRRPRLKWGANAVLPY